MLPNAYFPISASNRCRTIRQNDLSGGTPLKIRTRIFLLLTLTAARLPAQTVTPRHQEGRSRGFVVVRTLDGRQVGYGELEQSVQGERVTSRMIYRFRDGSLDQETMVFSQGKAFTLISDHHVQHGPFFSHPLDLTTDAAGESTNRTVDSDGKAKVETSHVDMPAGTVVTGMVATLMANLDPGTTGLKIAAITPTTKPRLLYLAIAPEGHGSFHIAGSRQTATVFRIKTELGGVAGFVAPIIGKQPDDAMIWVLEGDVPSIVRAITQFSEGGPQLDVQFAGATFPRATGK